MFHLLIDNYYIAFLFARQKSAGKACNRAGILPVLSLREEFWREEQAARRCHCVPAVSLLLSWFIRQTVSVALLQMCANLGESCTPCCCYIIPVLQNWALDSLDVHY